MFRRLFATPRKHPADVAAEIASLCHAAQFEILAMPKALRKDVGLDCGCVSQTNDLRHL